MAPLVLGPLAEKSLRQSLIGSHGSPAVFLSSSISLSCLAAAVLLAALPALRGLWRRRHGAAAHSVAS